MRRTEWKRNQAVDEVEAAKRFASLSGRAWATFDKVDGSDVDVVARSADGMRLKGNRYPATRTPEFILLVDLVPGGMATGFALHARQVLRDLLAEAAFKEVWLVGATSDHLFQLWP